MSAAARRDPHAFRRALGNFATGVTVVTAMDGCGRRVGVTVNSFSSVSLEPPLVLWSLQRAALSLPVFESADCFVVNVLADTQVAVSQRFARQGRGDKFAGLEVESGIGGAPVLQDCAACFQCRKKFTYEGGDHLIFVGEVVDFSATDQHGLIFHKGRYAVSGPHPHADPETDPQPSFVRDYLDYLLSQAAIGFEMQFQEVLDRYAVSRYEWRALCCISEFAGIDHEGLATLTIIPGDAVVELVSQMQAKGWVKVADASDGRAQIFIEQAGLDRLVPLLAAGKAHEADAMAEFTAGEARYLKEMLNTLIRRVNQRLCRVTGEGPDRAGWPGTASPQGEPRGLYD